MSLFLIYSFHLLLHLAFSFRVSFLFFFLQFVCWKKLVIRSDIFHSLNFACFIPVVSFNTFLEFLSCRFCHLGLNLETCSDSFLIFGQVYFRGAAMSWQELVMPTGLPSCDATNHWPSRPTSTVSLGISKCWYSITAV